MTEALFALVTGYGVAAIAVATFLSCLALPIPSSLMMLAGGGFAASGDLALAPVAGAAFGGAVLGDQTGFRLGRFGTTRLAGWIDRSPARAALLRRAHVVVERWGTTGVFFSTWAAAPLGPWVNFAAGAAGMNGWRFTLWDTAGEAIWVTVYVGLGYAFASNLDVLAGVLTNAAGALTAALIALVLGALLLRRRRDRSDH